MANRTRPLILRVPVNEQERKLIVQKMKLIPTKNFAAYARKMLIDGYIIQIDHSDIKAMTAEIQKIGVNFRILHTIKIDNRPYEVVSCFANIRTKINFVTLFMQ